MANFAEVADIEAFLQVEISTAVQIASATRALEEATTAIKNYTEQYIELVEDEEITIDTIGGTRIFLPELPVVSVASVIEDGNTLTADDDYKLGQHGILYRIGGDEWPDDIQAVTITYTHGYATIPDDIVKVATRAASRAYQAGLRAAESEAVLGVASKSLGDFSVSFGSESGGGVGEGIMGASAARFLLMSEKDILDKFRLRSV